ncbi:hypothetical protein PBAL39_03292 [Pedobacter sp. BAL39]|uniref:hypothetical protein n=1 Tax=Pedobacter sp. BAL39 TaxID=391596 RepID=UPI000155AC76|nr:hypothetical protein [Pedobacter sp. BAL39]EDM33891.1 hypothetical protein PBAL39_03292 [Pedobacter sp. BAL39]
MKPSALTKVLLKMFGYTFFREHSGLLLFFFVTILNYCFFIKTAGVYRAEDSVFYHLMLVMSFIVTPAIMIIVFIFWLIYSLKSWSFVSQQLRIEQNQFLLYSVTSSSKYSGFVSWFILQLFISLPFLGYWLLAMILGLIYQSCLIPILTLVYILLMAVVSAGLYQSMSNRFRKDSASGFLQKLNFRWKKPYFMFFIYQVVDRLKLAYLLTKILSLCMLSGILAFFQEFVSDIRLLSVLMLGLIILHSFLIYQEHAFQEKYLSFRRNLPFNRIKLYVAFSFTYVLLLLPEICWLFSRYNLALSLAMVLLGAGISLLLRSLVYHTGLKIFRYLLYVFVLFIGLFYALLSGALFWTTIMTYLISFLIFYFQYYRVKHIQ